MSDSFAQFQKTFEIFANKQAAQTEAVRAVLQGLLAVVLLQQSNSQQVFSTLRTSVLARLDNETNLSDADQDQKRKAVFVHEEAVAIFDEMAPMFGSIPSGSSGPTN